MVECRSVGSSAMYIGYIDDYVFSHFHADGTDGKSADFSHFVFCFFNFFIPESSNEVRNFNTTLSIKIRAEARRVRWGRPTSFFQRNLRNTKLAYHNVFSVCSITNAQLTELSIRGASFRMPRVFVLRGIIAVPCADKASGVRYESRTC